jgi:type II secretory ATPase GspE/PulE/Tfp pilus assembly ATPase PilB-like protein
MNQGKMATPTVPADHSTRRRLRLGEVLVSEGLATETEIQVALKQQKREEGKRLGEVLVEMGVVDEASVAKVLADRLGLRFIDLDIEKIDSAALKDVPAQIIREHQVYPIRTDNASVTIAIGDPLDTDATEAVQFACRKRVVEVVANPEQINYKIHELFMNQEISEDFGAFLRSLGGRPDLGDVQGNDAIVVKLVNRFIIDAIRERASDIHFEPYGDREEFVIRFRIDGQLRPYRRIPSEYRETIVARLKIMARLNIAERRLPQDGKIRFAFGEREIELRMVTLPTSGENEDVVLRILAGHGALPLVEMGLNKNNLKGIEKLVRMPYGLVLAVGPTGSGKTTTLHSMLADINDVRKKIWTVEDPVEITQPGLRQLQVQPQIGLSFAAAMRSFLRADPDIIMVGEMRDQETAHMAVEASLTGHLVLSTLHTNTAPETITRLIDMGLDPFSFSDALLGILSQRLARRLCTRCREEHKPTGPEYEELVGHLGQEIVDTASRLGRLKLWRSNGCRFCERTGYRGRLALHELLVNDDDIRGAMQRKATTAEIRSIAQNAGMRTLLHDGFEKCLNGDTDLQQVLSVCSR